VTSLYCSKEKELSVLKARIILDFDKCASIDEVRIKSRVYRFL